MKLRLLLLNKSKKDYELRIKTRNPKTFFRITHEINEIGRKRNDFKSFKNEYLEERDNENLN